MKNRSVLKRAGLGLTIGFGVSVMALPALPAFAADHSIQINGDAGANSYTPGNQPVNPGDTVTWTNRDATGTSHNAVCSTSDGCPVNMAPDPGTGKGHLYGTNQSASYTFQYSGTYTYHCNAHPNMKGTVVVSGDVHPPAAAGSGAGGGATAAPAAGSTAVGGSSTGAGAATGSAPGAKTYAKPGQPAAPGGTALNPAASDTTSTSEAVKQSLAGITLPKPNVVVRTSGDSRTPAWVVGSSAVALVVCAILFGLSWFGPPLRRGRSN